MEIQERAEGEDFETATNIRIGETNASLEITDGTIDQETPRQIDVQAAIDGEPISAISSDKKRKTQKVVLPQKGASRSVFV